MAAIGGAVTEIRRTWRVIARIWATLGGLALAGVVAWSWLAYQASDAAQAALSANADVEVTRGAHHWLLSPRAAVAGGKPGVVFFPGGLVAPAAYAPLAQGLARAGHRVLLMEVPWRGALGAADGSEVMTRAKSAMQGTMPAGTWVIAGHSRGGAIAARFLSEHPASAAGLILIGTSHPRDFSLAGTTLPVMKILGNRDGVAALEKSQQNRHLLPPTTRWVPIEGGNHSQFGDYGFQPGDNQAGISRDQQRSLTLQAMLAFLQQIAAAN